MSRQYPHSDTIQPRFAAWLWSIGGDSDPNFKTWAPRDWGFRFMCWVGDCKRDAAKMPDGGVIEDHALSRYYTSKDYKIIDHGAFTEACWVIADRQRAKLLPPPPY
jgi:hypothetical protein